jgi:hypothetical protein
LLRLERKKTLGNARKIYTLLLSFDIRILDQEKSFTSPRIIHYVLVQSTQGWAWGDRSSILQPHLPVSNPEILDPEPTSCEVIFDPSLRGLSGLSGGA